ncbi:lipid II:glycine glycyltransferase FemX [Bacteroidota bacterium]
MKIIKNNEIKVENWKELNKTSPFSSPFQTPEFYEFYNSLEGFSADVFAIEQDKVLNSLVVITIQKEKGIKSYFSRRGIIYGGPIIRGGNKNSFSFLLENINKYYKNKLIYLETRNYFDYKDQKDAFESNNYKYNPWLNFHLDTSDLNVMKKSMSSSRLRQIKKAIKNGVTWNEAKTINDVNTFYDILLDLYKNRIKKPLFSRIFFQEFYKKKMGKYLLVYYEDKVIGGIMCPIFNTKVIFEFFVCGLDKEFNNQYPSVMATWAAMEYANQNNIAYFDFMGAGSPNEDYGVREFKARFGGEIVEYGRFINVINPLLYNIGVFAMKILSKIK